MLQGRSTCICYQCILFCIFHCQQKLPAGSGFLEATVAALPSWRHVLASYPVVTWPSFTEYIRTVVNILASEEHMKEVMCQLQLLGEVKTFCTFIIAL